MFFLKIKYILIYLKSKFIKKNAKKKFTLEKEKFNKFIDKKKFSSKWFLNNFEIFTKYLPKNLDERFKYLEIGCYEGLSSLYILSNYKNVEATLVDLWDVPNINSLPLTTDFKKIENNFDENLNGYRFRKIKQDSSIAMRKLLKENNFFDFIYIDGSHNGEDILSDAIEAFKILDKHGIIFFDDFLQKDKNRSIQSYEGGEKFLKLFKKFIKILYFQNNLVIQKK